MGISIIGITMPMIDKFIQITRENILNIFFIKTTLLKMLFGLIKQTIYINPSRLYFQRKIDILYLKRSKNSEFFLIIENREKLQNNLKYFMNSTKLSQCLE